MTHQVLALKWRPRNFSEVIGQPHVVQALSNGLDNNRLHHAFLFTGTRGVGKTTLARIFAKSLNCEEGVSSTPCGVCSICQEVDSGRFVDLIEIDAASRTRVEDTREILDNVQYAPTRGRYKIYLIDEVHMLSNSSFNALLKTLEEPPGHVKFLLATTDPQKLPITVLSRCLRFQLKKISHEEILGQLEKLLTLEQIPFEREALSLIARSGEGSMRDALSLLDQAIAYTGSNINHLAVKEMLGVIDNEFVLQVLRALSEKKSESILSVTAHLRTFGLDYKALFEELITAFHDLTLIQINPEFSRSDNAELKILADLFLPEELQLFYQIALHARNDLHLHPNSELGFEMALLRMVLFAPAPPLNRGSQDSAGKKKASKNSDSSSQGQELTLSGTKNYTLTEQIIESTPEDTRLSTSSVENQGSEEIVTEVERLDRLVSSELASSTPVASQLHEEAQDEQEGESNCSEAEMGKESQESFANSPKNMLNNSASSLTIGNEIPDIDVESLGSNSSHKQALNTQAEAVLEQTSKVQGASLDIESKALIESIKVEQASKEIPSTSPQEIKLTNNEEWLHLLLSLQLDSVMSGIAHSLVLSEFNDDLLILERPKSVATFSIDEAENYLAEAISEVFGRKISCKIRYVDILEEENLHERVERIDEERYQEVLQNLKQDPIVSYLEKRYNARLLEKTIKLT